MRTLPIAPALIAALAAGCSQSPAGQGDPSDSSDDAIAGIAQNSFDEFGALNAAASLDAAGWVDQIGVSQKAAKKLEAAQQDGSFGLSGVFSLVDLVAIGDLTPAQVDKLLAFANTNDMVPTAAIRIPVMNQDGTFLFKRNGQMKTAGLRFFRKFMFLWEGDAGISQYVHFDRLGDQAQENDIDAEPSTGAGLIAGDGAGTLCYQGERTRVLDAIRAGISTVWSEQLQIFGSRAGDEVQLDEIEEADLIDALPTAERKTWKEFDTDGTLVIIAATTSDDGDDPSLDVLDACDP